jgi:transposase
MLNNQLLAQMIGITAPWKIHKVDVDQGTLKMIIHVNSEGTTWVEDGVCVPIHGYEERQWRHLSAFQFKTIIRARVPRVRVALPEVEAEPGSALQPKKSASENNDDDDPTSGSAGGGKPKFTTRMVNVPWAERGQSFTLLFEAFAIQILLNSKSVKSAADLMQIKWDQAEHIMQRAVDRGMARRVEAAIPAVGIDEKLFDRKLNFATLVCDLGKRCVLDLGIGRTAEKAQETIKEALTEAQREQVEVVTMDMSGAYAKAVKLSLPNATITYDRFHVAQLFSKAMCSVRRNLQRDLKEEGEDGAPLKGIRFLLNRNFEDLTEEQNIRLQDALDSNDKLSLAWETKEAFHLIWECESPEAAKIYFEKWHAGVKELPGLRPFKTAAQTIAKHLDGVLAWITNRLTNAFVEGINSLVQVIKSSARGFRNFSSFRVRILFHHGKLNMQPNAIG